MLVLSIMIMRRYIQMMWFKCMVNVNQSRPDQIHQVMWPIKNCKKPFWFLYHLSLWERAQWCRFAITFRSVWTVILLAELSKRNISNDSSFVHSTLETIIWSKLLRVLYKYFQLSGWSLFKIKYILWEQKGKGFWVLLFGGPWDWFHTLFILIGDWTHWHPWVYWDVQH